jgi:hypothetical protein
MYTAVASHLGNCKSSETIKSTYSLSADAAAAVLRLGRFSGGAFSASFFFFFFFFLELASTELAASAFFLELFFEGATGFLGLFFAGAAGFLELAAA